MTIVCDILTKLREKPDRYQVKLRVLGQCGKAKAVFQKIAHGGFLKGPPIISTHFFV